MMTAYNVAYMYLQVYTFPWIIPVLGVPYHDLICGFVYIARLYMFNCYGRVGTCRWHPCGILLLSHIDSTWQRRCQLNVEHIYPHTLTTIMRTVAISINVPRTDPAIGCEMYNPRGPRALIYDVNCFRRDVLAMSGVCVLLLFYVYRCIYKCYWQRMCCLFIVVLHRCGWQRVHQLDTIEYWLQIDYR
jgi:hypothetical protein